MEEEISSNESRMENSGLTEGNIQGIVETRPLDDVNQSITGESIRIILL